MKKKQTNPIFGIWKICAAMIVSLLVALPLTAQPQTDTGNIHAGSAAYLNESCEIRLPAIAIKSNLLHDLTTTINLGLEIGLARKWTLDIPVNYNPWKFRNDTRLRHFALQPELRYWFCERFSRWFVGLHGHYAEFNVGGLPKAIFCENMQKNRYQGRLYGGGVSIGHSWILKKRWSLEANIGAGYARIDSDKYPCAVCGNAADKSGKNYWGITRAGLSLIYTIK